MVKNALFMIVSISRNGQVFGGHELAGSEGWQLQGEQLPGWHCHSPSARLPDGFKIGRKGLQQVDP